MPLLIATDEAGYGPRLGPLVIVATAWQLQSDAALASAHQRLEQPVRIGAVGELRIDDSKRLFTGSKSRRSAAAGVSALDRLSDAAAAWAALPIPSEDFRQWLLEVAPDDLQGLSRQPWFALLAAPSPADPAAPGHAADVTQALIAHWSGGGLRLVGIAARVIDAARFNALLDRFANKADLLSHTTCELAMQLWQRHAAPAAQQAHIYSDRHGGRAYYGGLLQHHCPDFNMQVIQESATCSSYRLHRADDRPAAAERCSIDWSFTVSGDRYPPVALSSIIAKSTRERLMARFNAYFQDEAAKSQDRVRVVPLRPTAGYAVDAARFLRDIAPLRSEQALDDAILIRRK